jgi:hypothetical protein
MELLDAINVGERVAASESPTLVFSLACLAICGTFLWGSLRRQRKWVEKRLGECEQKHNVCMKQGQRRTSLLLQVLAIAQVLASGIDPTNAAQLGGIRAKVEELLDEEETHARSTN